MKVFQKILQFKCRNKYRLLQQKQKANLGVY